MIKSKKTKVIVITAVVALLAVIIVASVFLLNRKDTVSVIQNDSPDAIDLTGYQNTGDVIIRSASYLYTPDGKIDGYLVTVSSKGYQDMIQMDITFDSTGNIIKSVVIKDHKESENYGDKITDASFLNQFIGLTPPVVLADNNTSDQDTNDSANESENTVQNNNQDAGEDTIDQKNNEQLGNTTSSGTDILWVDGYYEVEESEFDDQGFKDKVSLTIENGKITEVMWDAYNEDGELKSLLSADGIYEMTTSGLTWQEQAIAIANYLIQEQSTDAIPLNGDGKTDVVTGVSISVKDFITLVKECLQKASKTQINEPNSQPDSNQTVTEDITDTTEVTPSTETEDNTDNSSATVDALSGATKSSAAVVAGINKAHSFIQEFVLKK